MNAAELDRIRALDVEWAHDYFTRITGAPFQAGPSTESGKWMTADEVALMSLHKLRTRVGLEHERKESMAWLRERGLHGVFGEALADQ